MRLPILSIQGRLQLILGAALGVFSLGFWGGWEAHAPAPIPPAFQGHVAAAQVLDTEAARRGPELAAAEARTARAEAELARLRARPAEPRATTPPAGLPELILPAADLRDAEISAQDQVIGAMRAELDLKDAQIATLTSANGHRQEALRLVVPPARPRPWSMGGGFLPAHQGQPREILAVLRRDAGPLFLEAVAIQSPLTGTRVGFTAGWRF